MARRQKSTLRKVSKYIKKSCIMYRINSDNVSNGCFNMITLTTFYNGNERHAYVLQQASDALGGPHTLRSLAALHDQNWQMSMENHPNRLSSSFKNTNWTQKLSKDLGVRRRETSTCNQISGPGENSSPWHFSQHLSASQHFSFLIEASAFRLRCTRRCSSRG